MIWVRRISLPLILLLLVLANAGQRPAYADATQAAIDGMLDAAHARGCGTPADVLDQVLCQHAVRVGVRTNYPGFGIRQDGQYRGFELDVARAMAERLGVRMDPVPVTPANRIEMVASGDVDMVIATMSHSVTRDSQIHFVRPHYYASHTAVLGPRRLALSSVTPVAGRTVCVPLGNVSNTALAKQGARLMIFDQPQHLLDALRFGRCALVAHDNTYFTVSMQDPDFASQFEEKLSVLPTPWGIGIARSSTDLFARLLALIVTDFHRSGTLVKLARQNQISDQFPIEQKAMWSNPACMMASGDPSPRCMMEPVVDLDAPTSIAPSVKAVEAWLHNRLGFDLAFPMLKSQATLTLFEEGIVNTLILVAGAIAATVGFALLIQYGIRQRQPLISVPTRWVTTVLQSSPVVLLLILGYFLATAVLDYGTVVSICTAIIVIGLSNGSFAGAAIAEAAQTLTRQTGVYVPLPTVLRHSATQITGFAVNAARASAVASFIGTPELLTALTDITSVTTEKRTTFTILLLFYMAVVMIVVWLAGILTRRFPAQESAA